MKKKLYLIIVPILVVAFVIGSFVFIYKDINKALNENAATTLQSTTSDEKNNSEETETASSNKIASTSSDSSINSSSSTDVQQAEEENTDEIVCVTYKVKEGDTLYSIANEYMPDYQTAKVVEFIMERNNIGETIKIGQELEIPTVEK